jgi:hypothetical protein
MVPFKEKDRSWKEQCVQAICSMGSGRISNGRSNWNRKQINYDLVNSILNESDFSYVLNPYGVKDKVGNQPAKLRNINLIVNKLNLLKGEEIQRPFQFQVVATNGNAINEKENQKRDLLMQTLQAAIAQELGVSQEPTTDPQTGEQIPPKTFAEVEQYSKYNLKDIREQWGNDILQYLIHEEQLELKFNEGWEHGLVTAEEIYYVGITNGQPRMRVCNPLNCEFDRNPGNPNIEDGDWFKEDRWMTKGQILDEFGEYLSSEAIEKLDRGNLAQGLTNQMFPGFAYTESDIAGFEKGNFANRSKSSSTHFLVSHVVWKSMKEIGFLKYTDENGKPQEGIVGEDFTLTREMKALGYSVEWRWISDVWHGTRIAQDVFVQIEQVPNQIRSMDTPSEVKLPYVGRVYNSTNSAQTSLVDLIKPHQYLYIIVWFRLEAELAKAKGKKMVMDVAQIPRSEGIDLDKWMYYFDNVGIAFINSFEEGKDKFQGQVSQFNQFQAFDMGLSQAVGQYIGILGKIEQTIDKMVGITPQREGQVHQSETVGGVERSVQGSSLITEPWFYIHNEIKRKALTQLLECAKFAYPSTKKIHQITDDAQRMSITIDMDKFADSDYGVFVTNSSKEHMILQKLEAIASQALSTGAAVLSDVVKMYKAKSVAEFSKLLEASEEKRNLQNQQQQVAQQEMQKELLAAQDAREDKKMAFESNENRLDREADIYKATISATSFDTDTQASGQVEAMAYSELALKQMDISAKNAHANAKLNIEVSEKAKDRALKEKEIASKEKIEKEKARVAMKNKVVGER